MDRAEAELVRLSTEQTDIGGSLLDRMSSRYGACNTLRAARGLARLNVPPSPALGPVIALLERKQQTLAQARRHIRIKTVLQVWLFVHVPVTFALLAALTAHIVSVFFYW